MDRLIILLSPYSAGSTITQKLFSKTEGVHTIRRPGVPEREAELGFLVWAAKFWKAPSETIAHDPVRVFDPTDKTLNPTYLSQYQVFLKSDPQVDETLTNQAHFFDAHLLVLLPNFPIEDYDLTQEEGRFQLILHAWIRLIKAHQPVAFGKHPKILHDASGWSVDLLKKLIDETTDKIKTDVILNLRNPLDVFVSQVRRRFRYDEVFGNTDMAGFIRFTRNHLVAVFEQMQRIKTEWPNVMVLKYEDMLEHPKKTLQAITDRLDLEPLDTSIVNRSKVKNLYLAFRWSAREARGKLGELAKESGYSVAYPTFINTRTAKFKRVRDYVVRKINKAKLVN